jgi:heptosyltransferase I
MKVLIVKMSAMGDILHALPLIPFLKAIDPALEIDWVVEEAFAGLLCNNPDINNLQIVRFKQWKKALFSRETVRDILNVRSRLVSAKYDLVFDIQGNIKSGMVAWLSGCPVRVGFERLVTQERMNALFTNRKVRLLPSDQHVTDQYLRVVSAWFGREYPEVPLVTDIVASAEDAAWAETFRSGLPKGRLFLLHTGTTWQTKFWYDQGWIDLGKQLSRVYPDATLLFSWGNDGERDTVERIAKGIGSAAIILERVPLVRLAALLKKMTLVIGGDTGVVHMAAAVGVATVSYYRSSDGLRSGPCGDRHVVVQTPLPCARCFKTSCEQDQECRQSITCEMIVAGVRRVVADGS